MNIFKSFRNGGYAGDGDSEAASSPKASEPVVAGFERLGERDAVARLPKLTQVELAAVEDFERAHRARPAVINKLRYLRQAEPLPGYDALESDGIEEALSGASTQTVKAAREYERKFQHRPTALKAIASALHRTTARPAAQDEGAETGDEGAGTGDDRVRSLVEGNGLPRSSDSEAGPGATA